MMYNELPGTSIRQLIVSLNFLMISIEIFTLNLFKIVENLSENRVKK